MNISAARFLGINTPRRKLKLHYFLLHYVCRLLCLTNLCRGPFLSESSLALQTETLAAEVTTELWMGLFFYVHYAYHKNIFSVSIYIVAHVE